MTWSDLVALSRRLDKRAPEVPSNQTDRVVVTEEADVDSGRSNVKSDT